MRRIVLNFAAQTLGRSIFVRSACLKCAQAGRYLRRTLGAGLPRLASLYVVSTVLVILHSVVTEPNALGRWQAFRKRPSILFDPPLFFQSVRWFFHGAAGPWLVSLALAALIAACAGAWRMRQRIVIVSFSNLTGEDPYKLLADSLSRRLMTQLSEITDVYQHVSDDPADLSIETDARRLALAVNPAAGAFSGLTASMKDQTVKVGPFSIPLEWTVTTFSTLLRGPQIGGSVQKSAKGLMLEASISGEGYGQSWRVGEEDVKADRPGGETEAAIVDRMIAQLGHRIFTDLNRDEIGTMEWRAGERYTEGLRAFRQAQRARGNAAAEAVALQHAGQQFLLAYREDRRFLRSRYNLGVINSYQNVKVAAYTVFEAVINDTSGWASSGLPGSRRFKRDREDLAKTHYVAAVEAWALSGKDPENAGVVPSRADASLAAAVRPWLVSAEYHCDMALSLQPWHAEACSMKADIRRGGKEESLWSRKACAISWWKLCRAVWAGNERKLELWEAVRHVAKLAEHQPGKASIRTLKQALSLEPEDSRRWFELGKRYISMKRFHSAGEAFIQANRESERALYWLWAACTEHILNPDSAAGRASWNRVLDIMGADLGQIEEVARFWETDATRFFPKTSFAAWREEVSRQLDRSKAIQRARESLPPSGAALPPDGAKLFLALGIDTSEPGKLVQELLQKYEHAAPGDSPAQLVTAVLAGARCPQ
jgi:tetratricopeptide (TPR) repeat protein